MKDFRQITGFTLFLLLILFFSANAFAAENSDPITLDDLLSGDDFQNADGEDVGVASAEKKTYEPKCIRNKIWLVPDAESLEEIEKNYTAESEIFKVYSGAKTATGIEGAIEKFYAEKKPDLPVIFMLKNARNMQSDEARLTDAEQRKTLSENIRERIKKEAGVELSELNSSRLPCATILAGNSPVAKMIKNMERKISARGPLFLLTQHFASQPDEESNSKSAESIILAKYSKDHIVVLQPSEKGMTIDSISVKTTESIMTVKVADFFSAPAATKVVILGAPDQLGGINDQEFAALAVYFDVCRVWGSDTPQTLEALKKFLDENLAGDTPVASAEPGANEPQIFDTPLTGSVEVNTKLNMRSSPWGPIVGKLLPGSQIQVVGQVDDWLIVEVNGNRVFVHQNYVSLPGKPASRQAPTPPSSTPPSAPPTTGGSSSEPATTVAADNPPQTLPAGSLNSGTYGYDTKRFAPVFDILEKLSLTNQKYSNKGDSDRRYHGPDHWTQVTDCSGLVGHFIDKLADAAGMPSPIPRSWYPDSQWYRTNQTTKITSGRPPTNPPDLIRPGDLFVMRREGGKYGHIGMFMGYTPSGQPIIAHSTGGTLRQERKIAGNVGTTGTRIEIMPSSYFSDSRWDGIFRLNAMDAMLDKLSS